MKLVYPLIYHYYGSNGGVELRTFETVEEAGLYVEYLNTDHPNSFREEHKTDLYDGKGRKLWMKIEVGEVLEIRWAEESLAGESLEM